MTKRVLKEASVSLDLTDLQSSDLDTLSRILSLAGQAESGKVGEESDVIDIQATPEVNALDLSDEVTEPVEMDLGDVLDVEPKIEDEVAVVEPTGIEVVDIDSEESLEDGLESDFLIDSITDEIDQIFSMTESEEVESQLEEAIGGDMEDDFFDEVAPTEETDSTLDQHMDEVEMEMNESNEVDRILGLSGLMESVDSDEVSEDDDEVSEDEVIEKACDSDEVESDSEMDRIVSLSDIKEGVIGEEVVDIFGDGGIAREDFDRRPEEDTSVNTLSYNELKCAEPEESEVIALEDDSEEDAEDYEQEELESEDDVEESDEIMEGVCNGCGIDPCSCGDGKLKRNKLKKSLSERWDAYQKGL